MRDALVVIDIQNDYFPGGPMELDGAEAAGKAAALLLARWREAGQPVFHVRHESPSPDSTFFLPGTPGAEINPCVAPQAGESVLLKHSPSAFRETQLLGLLRGQGAQRLTFCGMMTHMCVDTSVRAAFDLGFSCRLAWDACATRALSFGGRSVTAAQVQTAYLAALGAVFAQVARAGELSPA